MDKDNGMTAKRNKAWLIGLLGCMLSSSAWAVPGFIIKNDGSKVSGEEIRVKSNGDVVLRRGPGPIEFKKGTFKEAWAEKPSSWDAIVRAVEARQFAKVTPALKKIMADYKNLGWDGRAAPLLGRALLETGDASGALKTFEDVLSRNPGVGKTDSFKRSYWKALIANKKTSKVQPLLDAAIEADERELAAHAQLLRGDLNAANSRYGDALLDYLRTATLFKKVRAAQPAALLKTAQTMVELKDSRAKKFFQKVVDEYPNSPEAKEAQAQL